MAIDVYTEISSPRISFSYDLKELDISSIEENQSRRSENLLSNPTVDFEFCINGHDFPDQISSADELFANGKILPVQIKQISNPTKPTHHHKSEPVHQNVVVSENKNPIKKKKKLVEFLSSSNEEEEEEEEGIEKLSLNSKQVIGRANGLLRLRPLQFLNRSKSTGSVPNPNPPGFSKAIQKQHSMREGSVNYRSNSSGFTQYYYPYKNNNNTTTYKPTLRKSTSRSYGGNGVRINPVLNIPPVYIAKGTVSLFGSFFGSKKSKNKR